jgi:hypothetical protein
LISTQRFEATLRRFSPFKTAALAAVAKPLNQLETRFE